MGVPHEQHQATLRSSASWSKNCDGVTHSQQARMAGPKKNSQMEEPTRAAGKLAYKAVGALA